MSADTPVDAPRGTAPTPGPAIPQPGDVHDGRTVRASGALPYAGWPFVVLRHTGRQQRAALRSAQSEAGREKRELTQLDPFFHLLPHVVVLDRGSGLERQNLDDLLDLDGDDVDALFAVLAPSGERSPDGEPHPPTPSS